MAQTLRTGTAGSQDESRCSAIQTPTSANSSHSERKFSYQVSVKTPTRYSAVRPATATRGGLISPQVRTRRAAGGLLLEFDPLMQGDAHGAVNPAELAAVAAIDDQVVNDDFHGLENFDFHSAADTPGLAVLPVQRP